MPAPRAFRLTMLEPTEAQVMRSILRYLELHPGVAWAHRFNVGAAVTKGAGGRERLVRFAFRGCPDILGQLVTGRFLAIECKSSTGRVRPDQAAFIDLVNANGGLGLVARSVDEVIAAIEGVTHG